MPEVQKSVLRTWVLTHNANSLVLALLLLLLLLLPWHPKLYLFGTATLCILNGSITGLVLTKYIRGRRMEPPEWLTFLSIPPLHFALSWARRLCVMF